MEKVINEFKIIETDDGFRIEIKGDKEAIRQMIRGFGPRRRKRRFDHGFGFGFAPHFWTHFGDWCGSWDWEEEEAQEDASKAA
jgi:hypothetical protein